MEIMFQEIWPACKITDSMAGSTTHGVWLVVVLVFVVVVVVCCCCCCFICGIFAHASTCLCASQLHTTHHTFDIPNYISIC